MPSESFIPEHKPMNKPGAYREGYESGLSWVINGGPRPDNPYWMGSLDGESSEFEQWEEGLSDACFDS